MKPDPALRCVSNSSHLIFHLISSIGRRPPGRTLPPPLRALPPSPPPSRLDWLDWVGLQVVRWEDVMTDDLQERAMGGKGGGAPTSPAQLRRRCYMAAAEGLGLGRSGKVIRECLLERGELAGWLREHVLCVCLCVCVCVFVCVLPLNGLLGGGFAVDRCSALFRFDDLSDSFKRT